ncbi:MAG: epoxyqueuosine reductase [Bacteriovoracaceae bacterium]|nr:epoxyqueuosine reductase [Bacteriovoracaceae bacterium]
MTDYRYDLRSDLRKAYPDFKSALVFLFPYLDSKQLLGRIYQNPHWNGLKVASYTFAYDVYDYHYKLKENLNSIADELVKDDPSIDFKLTVDTAPILERDLAYRAGLGFFGDNAHLINQNYGSFFFIGSILLSKQLPLDEGIPQSKDCGHCTKCLIACPTSALGEDVDASKCVSTFSIETFKDATPPVGFGGDGHIFGCDICSEVCPWNVLPLKREAVRSELSEREQKYADFLLLRPIDEIINELEGMSNREYIRFFKGTAFERTGRLGILKNLIHYNKI